MYLKIYSVNFTSQNNGQMVSAGLDLWRYFLSLMGFNDNKSANIINIITDRQF